MIPRNSRGVVGSYVDGTFEQMLEDALGERRSADRLRVRTVVDAIDATHVRIGGHSYTNFCSNNYLGLTHHPAVIRAVVDATRSDGAGAGAAGLISGYSAHHAGAEAAIARWKGTESALLLPSGYQANHAIIQTLSSLNGGRGVGRGSGVRFLLDKLSHASLIDAVRGSQMPWRVYPHNGYAKLRRLVSEAEPGELQVVVTESIFSMDGDAADLAALRELKQAHPFFLVLDEAHGSGVYGPAGRGYAAELGMETIVDASILTLSKALGCGGGAICGSKSLCDAAVNFARAYIFSTSVPPGNAAGIEAAIGVVEGETGRRKRLRELARRVRGELGLENEPADSPIIPVIFGDESRALKAAERLREEGLLVVAVRPPTVAPGSSRLRITVCSEHTDDEVTRLITAVKHAQMG